jgi:uncharacterized protein YdeI (YjbR/CyaY-like superfamily)
VSAIFFRSPAQLRKWFEDHHAAASELWVGYCKKDTGRSSIMWPESVDEALCFGWIDGIRKGIDGASYQIRFTPRRPGSIWSGVNIRRARALIRQGHMRPAGRAAFQTRQENRSGIYSYEQRRPQLEEPYARMLRKHSAARKFFDAQPPSYKKAVSWWVVSAKKEATRLRRLEKLIAYSDRGETLPEMSRPSPRR